jgi:hypothetical protein
LSQGIGLIVFLKKAEWYGFILDQAPAAPVSKGFVGFEGIPKEPLNIGETGPVPGPRAG